MNLEDEYEDIIAKSMAGLGFGDTRVAREAGIDPETVQAARKGNFNEAVARAIAPVIDCDAEALVAIGRKCWVPDPVKHPGLYQVTTPWGAGYPGMTVNAYLTWKTDTREALIFDAGADPTPLIDKVKAESIEVKAIFLTHSHPDHIAGLETLKAATGSPPVYISEAEPLEGCQLLEEGDSFSYGEHFRLSCHLTPGHSRGGMTYVIHGLGRTIAMVGDALFAGSMGGAPRAWNEAKAAIRRKILSLPEDAILCPGHGPMTTVAEESRHNPFFAEKKEA